MTKAHTEVLVDYLPNCDFCHRENKETPASYDGKTILGPWANMCQKHFEQYGIGLGLGKGQRLIKKVPHEPVKGEQTGMLGVPGKVHTQKRPYEAGQMEFESYAKYQEAMPFIKVGDRVRYIDKIKGRRGTWPEGVWLEKGMEGTVIEYHPRIPAPPIPSEEPIEAYAVVKFDNGASSAIDSRDEGEQWERVKSPTPSGSNLHWKTVAELRQSCSQRGLPTDGGKEDLIRRLK